MSVAIVDYGSGNLHSAAKAFERAARESGHDQPIKVTRDPEDVLDLRGIARRDLGDPHEHLDHVADVDVRPYDAGLLGAREQRLAGAEERSAAGLEELRVPLDVFEQLGGERLLGCDVSDEALEPAVERLPGVVAFELGGRAAELLDLVDEDDEINCLCNQALLRCGRGLGDQTFQANQTADGVVCVDRGRAAGMSGVPRLQHDVRFCPAHLAHHNACRLQPHRGAL